jgi:hypothetical protein
MQESAATIPKRRHAVFKKTFPTRSPTWSLQFEINDSAVDARGSRQTTNPESISRIQKSPSILHQHSEDRRVKVSLMTPNLTLTPLTARAHGKLLIIRRSGRHEPVASHLRGGSQELALKKVSRSSM